MADLQHIIRSIDELSRQEKLELRSVLDAQLEAPPAENGSGTKPTSGLLGLFADEPELMDQVMESVYENRARPLRID